MSEQIKPWGSLEGVRPAKLLHRLIDLGHNFDASFKAMHELYGVSGKKFQLLWSVVNNNREIMAAGRVENLVSIYIGIPFCPSRCFYCSFPSHSISELGDLRQQFLHTLLSEIEISGKHVRQYGFIPYSVYLGGGTPTVLSPAELGEICEALKTSFPGAWCEFTVEAGRPDTLEEGHFEVFKQAGVSRISINPQSMHDSTLALIGRRHSSEDVVSSFTLARQAGIPVINMDLIAGLPGEDLQMVEETVRQVLALQPENITLHTLSRKRASLYDKTVWQIPEEETVKLMHEKICASLTTASYRPYYLYRQRNIPAGLENIGFSLPGRECAYNVCIIEERHHVLGLGAGATSKFINVDLSLQNICSPKDVRAYLQRMPEFIKRRKTCLFTYRKPSPQKPAYTPPAPRD